ncbi:MAG: hypothetical protein RR942_06410 [Romboutsia sp.]
MKDMDNFDSAMNMYNQLPVFLKNKVDFLNERKFTHSTCKNVYRTFYKLVYQIEQLKNKDLSQFNRDDVIELIQSVPTSSMNTIKHAFSVIKGYETWAIENGLNHSGEDPTQKINLKEIAIVNSRKIKNNYISYDEIFDMWQKIKTGQNEECDQITEQNLALVLLIRMGLRGNKWSEVLFLEKDDIDFENKIIHVTNRDQDVLDGKKNLENVKDIDIKDDRIINILKEALEVKEYTYERGVAKTKVDVTRVFEDSNFIIKREVGYPIITPTIFRNRLALFFSAAEEKYIAAKDLFKCAELDMIFEIKNKSKYNKLFISDFLHVHKFFEPKATSSGYVTIKELYTNMTGDNDILKENWLLDKEGNRVEYIPDYSKYRK